MQKINQIRQALKEKFGARQYRITKDGEVHVRGIMPNSNTHGWYLLCDLCSVEDYL